MDPSQSALAVTSGTTLSQGPNGCILSYGVSYTTTVADGKEFVTVPACPRSAQAVHEAFVSKCGFSNSPMFPPTLDNQVAKDTMINDVRRVAGTMASHDVVVLYFSGHGMRQDDTACVFDGAGCVVSLRELQAAFAETVVARELRDVAFVVVLDCCQKLYRGKPWPTLLGCCTWLCDASGGAGVADPSETSNADERNLVVADAGECSWFVGFAASPGTVRVVAVVRRAVMMTSCAWCGRHQCVPGSGE